MITAWRIVEAQYADEIFSGEGARLFAARWHEAGHRLVYTASTISLATLELIVNTPRARLLTGYVITSCTFPEVLVEELDETRLPANWRDIPPPPELQQLGMTWLLSGSSAVLSVPSAVTPEERNYLINPEHEHFRSVDVGATRPFQIDLRLLT
ncbi:MAG TPA: RES family NAD+ phosphorylase [Thermoanaerobaculia bacterium]|nr:RES family NAD+ phosphorylase [Thermoanaerobaculia bacterium]